MNKVQRLEDTLSRIEGGRPSSLDLAWCADTVSWLWKWRKISREKMENFADRITKQFEMERNAHANRSQKMV